MKCQLGNLMISILKGINENKITEYRVDVSNETEEGNIELFRFTKDMLYIMGLTSYNYYFENQNKQQITGYTVSKNKENKSFYKE